MACTSPPRSRQSQTRSATHAAGRKTRVQANAASPPMSPRGHPEPRSVVSMPSHDARLNLYVQTESDTPDFVNGLVGDGEQLPPQHGLNDGPRPCLGSRRKRGTRQQAFGRSRGGFTCKVHCLSDARGIPLVFHLTDGEAADCTAFDDPARRSTPCLICSPTRATTPTRSAARCATMASAPPSRRVPIAGPKSVGTDASIASATASSARSATSRSTAPSPPVMTSWHDPSPTSFISPPSANGYARSFCKQRLARIIRFGPEFGLAKIA